MEGTCVFCGEKADLLQSHVLPAFVFRWLRNRSGQGYIRRADKPNIRVQDGLKLPWLCFSCEGHFGKYEKKFATQVFHPWHNGDCRIRYEEWMLKFAVSISWRVLKYARYRNPSATYSEEQNQLMDAAEVRWRAFLMGEVPHPDMFEQHLLIFDFVETTSIADLPSNFNRFMTGAVDLDIVGSNKSLMTFAKMGRFIIFGIIQKGPNSWEGTKIHVREGLIKPGKFVVPAGLIDLFRQKSRQVRAAMSSISDTQRAKIDKGIQDNIDDFAKSDQFAALMADAEMFGVDAVISKYSTDQS